MSEQQPQEPTPQEPTPERVPLVVRIITGILVGGFVMMVLVLGTCALMINWPR